MAKLGLKYPVYKGATSGQIADAIQADITIELNNAKLPASDAIKEYDNSFKSGKITLGIDDITDTVQAEILGHTVVDGEITASATDTAPYVGIGFYTKKVLNKVSSYRATWIPQVMFNEPNDSNKTKGESVEFTTYTLEGIIIADSTGVWKNEKVFATEADAIAYLNTKAGIPVSASTGLSALSMTSAGGTLSPAFGAGVRYYTYGGVTAASVTVTATAALHTISLYADGVFVQTLTSGAASAAISMTAALPKKLTIVAQETGKQSQTTEIVVVKVS